MADSRVTEHARILVNYSCRVKRNDFVIVSASPDSHDLVVALASELGRVGAQYLVIDLDDRVSRAFALAADRETLAALPPQLLNLFKEADVIINVGALSSANTQELADVPGEKLQALARAFGPLAEVLQRKRWNLTLHPTNALAQEAKMSYEAYCDFVYSAILRDWPKFESEMRVLSDRMAGAKKVRIVGKDTDITLSIEGRRPKVSAGDHNMPSGEVFVSPVETEVNGEVYFDLPVLHLGREVKGVRLSIRNGVVVDSKAEEGEEFLKGMLLVDEGAKRLGELGIGMNRGIDRFTRNILFDEKMGDTIHMAVGRGYEETGGINRSAIHIDMIKSMKEGGTMYFDDDPIYERGKFVWE
jgi:aminopeptidase